MSKKQAQPAASKQDIVGSLLFDKPGTLTDLVERAEGQLTKAQLKSALAPMRNAGDVIVIGGTPRRQVYALPGTPLLSDQAHTAVQVGKAAKPPKKARKAPAKTPGRKPAAKTPRKGAVKARPAPSLPAPVPAAAAPAVVRPAGELGDFCCGLFSNGHFLVGVSAEERVSLNPAQFKAMYDYLDRLSEMAK